MWNCDGPPSCPFDQTYPYRDRIYVSRHSSPYSSVPHPSYDSVTSLSNPSPTRHLPIPRQRPHEILRVDDVIPCYLVPLGPLLHYAALHRATLPLHRIVIVHPIFRIISLAFSSVKCALALFQLRACSEFFKARFDHWQPFFEILYLLYINLYSIR